jgi:hypothetical protein
VYILGLWIVGQEIGEISKKSSDVGYDDLLEVSTQQPAPPPKKKSSIRYNFDKEND